MRWGVAGGDLVGERVHLLGLFLDAHLSRMTPIR
ncbi:hypothetical protein SAMN04489731_109379 [Amycolatopsis regifaucium]|nr:hypothetical protein SAMN04489731_109379 [Amycolatopsis regifaucium]